jgi:peptidoglycan/LPS O-acetylase OafA/YrhL
MRLSSSRHVPELDGIRGTAIIAVLIHHQLTSFSLTGGFLGVDLFFVLSGFLITGLLVTEFQKTGSISLRNFYMRRVLRLGPALATYLVACLAVAYYTQAIDFNRQIKLILIALGYATNWRMAFGWDRALDPTAIIWSLSIEEQFYVAWPLILSVCLLLKMKRRYIGLGLAVIIIAILVHRAYLFSAGADLSRLYYGTDTRADALLIGCLFALLPSLSCNGNLTRWLQSISVVSAVALLFLNATVTFTDGFLYAGGFTGVALLAGVVIWVSTNAPPRILTLIFTASVLRWFGKISYGLYLWHWLIVRTTSFYYLGYWEPWARLALATGIAAASFYLVETKINKLKSRFSARPEQAILLAPAFRPVVTVARP